MVKSVHVKIDESIKSVGVIGSRSLPFTLFLSSRRHRPGLTRQALPYCHRRNRKALRYNDYVITQGPFRSTS